jgi:hypothetical protein
VRRNDSLPKACKPRLRAASGFPFPRGEDQPMLFIFGVLLLAVIAVMAVCRQTPPLPW